jgi:hypothetical protein
MLTEATGHDMLREFLAGRDVPCPGCTYNLRDLTGDRCPECGQELVLGVRLAEPKLAAMLTGLIGLSAGAGLNGLLVIYYFVVTAFRQGQYGGYGTFLWVNTTSLLVMALALAAWLRYWRRIRMAPPYRRWLLAAGCWALALADILVFSLLVQ